MEYENNLLNTSLGDFLRMLEEFADTKARVALSSCTLTNIISETKSVREQLDLVFKYINGIEERLHNLEK